MNEQKQALRKLWNKEYPIDIRHENEMAFESYLSSLSDQMHLLLIDEHEQIKAWYFDFIRDGSRWFAMILDHEIQGKGYGRSLLEKGRSQHPVLYGWVVASSKYLKEDGTAYRSPVGFYQKMGFQIFANDSLQSEKLDAIKIKWTR